MNNLTPRRIRFVKGSCSCCKTEDEKVDKPIEWLITTTCLFVMREGSRLKTPDPEKPCVLCFRPDGKTGITTKCGHHFHHRCIEQWCQKWDHCPACKDSIGFRLKLAQNVNHGNEVLCPICRSGQPTVTLSCQHAFHPECVLTFAPVTQRCILCKCSKMTFVALALQQNKLE